jgi:hypothetical protein
MSEQRQGFKRINFFKGFLTTEKDWNDAERYHIDKRRLHNRMLHSPGVVLGYGGDLRVNARARGDLSVEVQPGYAIDGQGTDFIAYKENLEYKGHRRVLESCRIELSQSEPDITREVELARVYLEKGANRLRDARDPSDPKPNEIDMRFVPKGGLAGSTLSPQLRNRLDTLLSNVRHGALEYTRHGVNAANGVVGACNTALMLMFANLLDLRNVFDVFRLIIDAEGELVLDVEVHHPTIAQKKEFAEYRRQVEILRGLLAEGKNTLEAYQNLIAYQAKCAEVAASVVAGEKPQIEVLIEKKDAPKVIDLKDWEGVKTMPQPKPQMDLEGTTWVLVDEIEILNKESEEKHLFTIKEAKDSYRSRQKLKYPDGTTVEDTGRAHVDGYSEFKLLNITAGRPVVVVRRMDYVYGDYELELTVNGKKIVVSCVGTDRVHRWRNWPAMIPAEAVTGGAIIVRQQSITAGRDINMFHIWAYQPK